jgi:L-ascorbate metabolism protein UlaG (beta-lactamase superfamily)
MLQTIRNGAVVAVLSAAAVFAAAASDTVPASGGDITITPINHATVEVAHAGKVILVDPVAQGSYSGLPAPDIILITDIHGDHLDPATVVKVKKADTRIVVPAAVEAKLATSTPKVTGAIVMANGGTQEVDGVRVEAVPMYNVKRGPSPGQLYHTKGRGNGYIVTLGGKRVYFAGDTECTPEMRALKNIDVAFVPMNLPYTMPPAEAAECVKTFRPKIVYPYHYRGSDPKEFAAALEGTGIEVRLRDWYGR